MNNYEARWNTAKRLAETILVYVNDPTYVVTYIDEEIKAGELKIDSYSVFVKNENYTYFIFVNDPYFDEGSHWTTETIINKFKDGFKVYMRKEVQWI
jgi:hypothetical protein